MELPRLTDPAFVQNPYPTYAAARAAGPLLWWEDWGMHAAFDHATVHAALRDKRLGRAPLTPRPWGDHLCQFAAFEQNSLLDLEPPRHTRLRGLVLRAFTSRHIQTLATDITEICATLIDALDDETDLIPTFCQQVPVRIIARLLGVPETMSPDLLRWSHDMVAMYQAGRTRDIEDAAETATHDFTAFLRTYIETRRTALQDDLISHLITAEEDGAKLSPDEMIATCILLLNAGHEATVHSLGNAVSCLLRHETPSTALIPENIADTVEELLRYDPPLHVFTRFVYEEITLAGHTFSPGEEIALVLGAATRDPDLCPKPDHFNPFRKPAPHTAFGGGIHFCVGAPLARLEMQVALMALFNAFPAISLMTTPRYSNTYHFHKLDSLHVRLPR